MGFPGCRLLYMGLLATLLRPRPGPVSGRPPRAVFMRTLAAAGAFPPRPVGVRPAGRPSSALARPGVPAGAERISAAMGEVFAEFERACSENPAFPSFGLCFPDASVVTAALSRPGVSFTSNVFLSNLHQVITQLHAWPPAWPSIVAILDTTHPWTQAYCDRVIGSDWWSPVDFFSVSFRPVYPLLRHTHAELREDFPEGAEVLDRWFDALRSSEDLETRRLLERLEAQDTVNTRERALNLTPLEELLQHLQTKVAKHILTEACVESSRARAVLDRTYDAGRNILHHAAQQGNTPLVEVLIRAKPQAERAQYVSILDNDGYSAEDHARLGHFFATVSKIRELGGYVQSRAPKDPVKLFAPPNPLRAGGQSQATPVMGTGGWNTSGVHCIPPEWLPAGDQPCGVDSICMSQFDWSTFEKHYLRHRRPLLIRGGVQLEGSVSRCYTRGGLLEAAGDRVVHAFDLPYGDNLRGAEPVATTLREYVSFLGARAEGTPSRDLSYVFIMLPRDEEALGFAPVLPKLLRGRIRLRTTQFTVGGVLMGSPMHHHLHAANSLIHGRKLWLLKPPAEQEFRKTVMYHDLLRSGGAPGVARCIQEAGDLLFVPSGWIHGALCLCDCAGVAHEFHALEPEFDDCDTSDLERLAAESG